jgi:hypothetical protein
MNADFGANPAREKVGHPGSPNNLIAQKARSWRGLWYLTLVGLVSAILCLPFIRFVHCLCSDEGIFLHGAELMLTGSRLYVDFFEFLPPGSFVITAAWFGIAGISMLSARSLAILTFVGIACFTYLACRQASKHATSSALLTLGWLVMSLGPWIQVSHHWFTTLCSMVVIWATLASIEHSQRWLWGPLIAGVAAGAAVMVTPTQGAAVALAAATAFGNLRRYRAELVTYVLGSALIPICLFAYVIGYGGITEAFNDVILFPAARYARVAWAPYAYGQISWQNLPLVCLFPVAAVLTLLICVRRWRTFLHERLLRSCAAFNLAGIVTILSRPDIYHITYVAPLALPLIAYCASRAIGPWLPKSRYAAVSIVVALCIPLTLSFLKSQRAVSGEVVSMPRGSVTIPHAEHGSPELAAWIAATPIEDAYFFYPMTSLMPFLTAHHHVSRYDIFTPNYTLSSQYQEACVSAMRRASWVVIDRNWTNLGNLKATFPTMPDTMPLETKRFEQALEKGFEFVARKGSFEIRRRVKSIDENICDGIVK